MAGGRLVPGEAAEGSGWWRHLAELAGEAAREEGEFPASALAPLGLSRRRFLQLLGASAALAGSGCFESPAEHILPYTRRPPGVTPGRPLSFATTMETDGFGTGVLVQTREGRPIKVEGNPDHPASLGSAGVFEQAWLLGLYDPHRGREVLHRGVLSTWARFLERFAPRPDAAREAPGLRVLLEPTASPLLADLARRLAEARPGARVHLHAPLSATRHATAGAEALFGEPLQPIHHFAEAAVVFAADADFAARGPFALRYAREFAARRRIRERSGEMNRLYVVEPAPTPTGSIADHRWRRPASHVDRVLAALLAEVLRQRGRHRELVEPLTRWAGPESDSRWIRVVADDLLREGEGALVVVGDRQPAAVHALGLALDAALGSLGRTTTLVPTSLLAATREDALGSLEALVEGMRGGEVDALVVLGGNPVYSAPPELGFAEALERVPTTACLALHHHETARRCAWFVPALHGLESWGDARALDGTASLVQPLVRPLYGGHTAAELLALLQGGVEATAHELVRAHWLRDLAPGEAEQRWEAWLRAGVVAGSAPAPRDVTPRWEALARLAPEPDAARTIGSAPSGGFEVIFDRDASVHDGRFADNPWLQELPDPVTKLAWDNAAWLSPHDAERLGVGQGEWLRIAAGGRTLEIPALAVPGAALGTIALHLGYGRDATPVSRGAGFDVTPLLPRGDAWWLRGARVEVLRDREPYRLANTQTHWNLHERAHHVVHDLSLERYRRHTPSHDFDASLYDATGYSEPQWGMAVDLTLCTGCSACVVACQAENNIPVVGKEGVLRGREMHWLRIDRYHRGTADEPETVSQPMLCQHCRMAPCEYVCPVNATVHSRDGLNEMIYNRCIGTRFCSNNCPYKVRRFNYLEYNGDVPPVRRMQHNPEVTVRARGVMEKCTYCVQRIRTAQIEMRREGGEGVPEVRTACQEACPTEAIVFGNVADPDAHVSRVLRAPQTYAVLEELGTEPRTRYLARIRNPNPRLRDRGLPRVRTRKV